MPPPIKRTRDVFHQVRSFDDALELARRNGRQTGRFHDPDHRSQRPAAMVNCGRWVALCPFCHNAMPIDPDWPHGVCVDCGGIYTIDFPPPPRVADIEAALLDRPEPNRNWLPGETIALLHAENVEHGIGRGGP